MLIYENMPGVRMVSGIYAWLQLCKLKHVGSIQGVVEKIEVILAEIYFPQVISMILNMIWLQYWLTVKAYKSGFCIAIN